MTSARSCKTPPAISAKNPERTWMLEMLRRCKALPILIAVAYFLSNILPVLLSYSRFERVLLYTYNSMTGANLLNMAIGIAGGIVVSCAVFRYLHGTASMIDAHVKPLTRTQLLRGSFFAGLIMVLAPVVLTGLFYLCIMGAHTTANLPALIDNWGMSDDIANALSIPNITGWTLDSILVIGFTYCVSCFAAILAGTAVVQALLSLVLVALPSVVYSFFIGYMSTFLYGYDGEMNLLSYLSPYSCLVMRGEYPFASVPVTLIIYAVISALLVFAAAAIYRRIRLENEENTIVVPFVAEILVILLTAIAVSMTMFIARSFLSIDTTSGSVITIVLASVVFFPIFCMIADQSFRIFKGRNVGVFLVYGAIMCVILAFTLFDVTGFEKNIPAVSEVKSVTVTDSNLIHSQFKGITDEQEQALITDLHRSIAEAGQNRDIYNIDQDAAENGSQISSINGIEIIYKLEDGKTLKRYYPAILPESFDTYAKFFDSKPVRKHECFNETKPVLDGQYLTLTDSHVDETGTSIDSNLYKVPDKNMTGLVRAANKDVMNWTAANRKLFIYENYDPAKDISAYSIDVSIDYRLPEDVTDKLQNYISYYYFTTNDRNIAKYLKEHPEVMSKKNVIQKDDPILGEGAYAE